MFLLSSFKKKRNNLINLIFLIVYIIVYANCQLSKEYLY